MQTPYLPPPFFLCYRKNNRLKLKKNKQKKPKPEIACLRQIFRLVITTTFKQRRVKSIMVVLRIMMTSADISLIIFHLVHFSLDNFLYLINSTVLSQMMP